jgi:hypothetical protein
MPSNHYSLDSTRDDGDGLSANSKHRAKIEYDDPVNPALKGGTEDRAFMAAQEAEFVAEINDIQADTLTEVTGHISLSCRFSFLLPRCV